MKYTTLPKKINMLKYTFASTRITNDYYADTVPTLELDLDKIHDEILQPIGLKIKEISDSVKKKEKIIAEIIEPSPYYKPDKHYGDDFSIGLILYNFDTGKIYKIYDFKLGKLISKINGMDFTRDESSYQDLFTNCLVGYPQIRNHLIDIEDTEKTRYYWYKSIASPSISKTNGKYYLNSCQASSKSRYEVLPIEIPKKFYETLELKYPCCDQEFFDFLYNTHMNFRKVLH